MRFCDMFGMPTLSECVRELVYQLFVKLCGETRPLTGAGRAGASAELRAARHGRGGFACQVAGEPRGVIVRDRQN